MHDLPEGLVESRTPRVMDYGQQRGVFRFTRSPMSHHELGVIVP